MTKNVFSGSQLNDSLFMFDDNTPEEDGESATRNRQAKSKAEHKNDPKRQQKKSVNQILKQIITPVLKMQEAPETEKEPLVTAPALMTYRSCLMTIQLRKIVQEDTGRNNLTLEKIMLQVIRMYPVMVLLE